MTGRDLGGRGPAGRELARWMKRLTPLLVLVSILMVSGLASIGAMRRTSATFDEIVMVAAGARGFHTGRFDLVPEHPPLAQYAYGLPVHLAGAAYPQEQNPQPSLAYRYEYARRFFWQSGNDPEEVAFRARLVGVGFALLLVVLVYTFTRRAAGEPAALLAAALVAFLPDVLAHGGVAYTDVPLAALFFAAIWAADELARRPGVPRAAAAGALFALALAVKFSALLVLPAAGLLLAAEAAAWGLDRRWALRLLRVTPAAAAAAYLVLVIVYPGDFGLGELRYGLAWTSAHVAEGHGARAFLLGRQSADGWWYFFPVAFLFKTPAALHVLALVAAAGLMRSVRRPTRLRLASRLRLPLAAGLVVAAALLSSNLAIGFRYALPALAPFCILVAAGVTRVWRTAGLLPRLALAGLVAWYAGSSLSYYPHFLAYMSEYTPSRDRGYEVLVDSSLDWGQGLLELRDFMLRDGIPVVYLSYFGSAAPEGYGIDYVPLPSPFPVLRASTRPGAPPSYAVISATNLQGVYFQSDLYAAFRRAVPDRVLAHTLFVYRLDG